MPTINLQADVSVEVLVQAVEQLQEVELRQFTAQILALNAKRTAPSMPHDESELLWQSNSRLPEEVERRYNALIVKRDAEILSEDDYAELLRLTQQVEAFEVARLEALSQLSCRRGVTRLCTKTPIFSILSVQLAILHKKST